MDLLSVIWRWRFRVKLPIREIGRRTGLSRNTIRKYLRSGVVEPVFKVPDRPSKLDPYTDKLSAWLRIAAGHDLSPSVTITSALPWRFKVFLKNRKAADLARFLGLGIPSPYPHHLIRQTGAFALTVPFQALPGATLDESVKAAKPPPPLSDAPCQCRFTGQGQTICSANVVMIAFT